MALCGMYPKALDSSSCTTVICLHFFLAYCKQWLSVAACSIQPGIPNRNPFWTIVLRISLFLRWYSIRWDIIECHSFPKHDVSAIGLQFDTSLALPPLCINFMMDTFHSSGHVCVLIKSWNIFASPSCREVRCFSAFHDCVLSRNYFLSSSFSRKV